MRFAAGLMAGMAGLALGAGAAGEDTLRDRIEAVRPPLPEFPPLQRKLIYDHLAALDPAFTNTGWYRAREGEVRETGPHVALPAGAGDVLVFVYRREGDAPLELPPAETLAAAARPERVDLSGLPIRELSVLRGLTPRDLDLSYTEVGDLAPLAAMTSLERLRIAGLEVDDLGPLAELKLKSLDISRSCVADLAPLANMPLVALNAARTPVSALAPLARLPLERLILAGTRAEDLAPLADLPLVYLDLGGAPVGDLSPVRGMPLRTLFYAPPEPPAGLDAVRAVTSLETIQGRPAEQWRFDYDRGQVKEPDLAPPPAPRTGEQERDPTLDDMMRELE